MKGKLIHWMLLLIVFLVTNACIKNSYVDRVQKGDTSCAGNFETRAMKGAGLGLSGGGYRATLFHLGALKRLNEMGLLHRMDEVSSVSGGSITSGQLATYIARQGETLDQRIAPNDWESGIATPLYTLTEQDIRTGPILRRYFIPWNWFDSTAAIDAVADRLHEDLTDLMLQDLPTKPDFVFNATEMGFGANWEMRSWRMGSYRTGYMVPVPSDWPLAKAVAASAAFPPVLQPMKVEYDKTQFNGYTWRDKNKPAEPSGPHSKARPIHADCWKTGDWEKVMGDLRISDGGVYDNLGLEPIWKDRKYVFVSDGGKTLDAEPDEGFNSRLTRWNGIMSEQAGALRKRMLYKLPKVTPVYWSIGDGRQRKVEKEDKKKNMEGDKPVDKPEDKKAASVPEYKKGYPGYSREYPGYSKDVAANFISYIRTDLNGFSEVERKILENHGYFVANAAVMGKVRKTNKRIDCDKSDAARNTKRPKKCPKADAAKTKLAKQFIDFVQPEDFLPAQVPHPEWAPTTVSECEIKKALVDGYEGCSLEGKTMAEKQPQE